MKYLCLIAFLCVVAWIPDSFAQSVAREKKYSGRFAGNKGILEIDNRYGKLTVNTWDKNEVTVDITVKVKAASAAAAQELLDRVRIAEPDGNSGNISYKTIIESRASGTNSSEFSIDYLVHMPRKQNTSLINKYGDIILADVEGKIEIDLKYGKLNAGSFRGNENHIRVAYGGATINSIETGTVMSSYSKLAISKAGNIDVSNKYGKTEIGNVRTLEVEQKYGDLEIGSVSVLQCNIQFAGFSVDKLLKSVLLNMRYGSGAKFEYVGPGVDNIQVSASYSNITFHLDKDASLAGDISLSYGNVKNNVNGITLSSSGDDRPGRSSNYSLKAGSGKGRFSVNGSYGNVTFR